MTLPLPRLLFRATTGADPETKENLELFEGIIDRLEPSVKQRIMFLRSVPFEFPQLVVSYAFASLQRIRLTAWGTISALNSPNEVLYVLATRTLVESSANMAYLHENLRKTYAGILSRKEMSYLALRMKFATRKPDDMELTTDESKTASAVNVLTTLKALDRFAESEFGYKNPKTITGWYERLCEFAHPNALGNSVGSELDFANHIETFDIEPVVREAVLAEFSRYARLSLYAFCLIYNDCLRMLYDANEKMPLWEPSGDPMIQLC